MKDETKDKLIDVAIVTAKATAMAVLSGGRAVPLVNAMWRNQRNLRKWRELHDYKQVENKKITKIITGREERE
jgi:hypothetical protein